MFPYQTEDLCNLCSVGQEGSEDFCLLSPIYPARRRQHFLDYLDGFKSSKEYWLTVNGYLQYFY